MTDHDALAALLHAMEKSVADHEHDVADRMVPCDLRATWNELRLAAGVRVTGDAGLREAAATELLDAVAALLTSEPQSYWLRGPVVRRLREAYNAVVEEANRMSRAALTGDTPEAAPDTARPEACEFVPAHEPWSCRVHHGIRTRLDVTVCSRIVPARLESEDIAAHLAWLRDGNRLAQALDVVSGEADEGKYDADGLTTEGYAAAILAALGAVCPTHLHLAGGERDDRCAECGHDLRALCHERATTTPTTQEDPSHG